MKLCDKAHSIQNVLFLYMQSSRSLRKLCMAPETVLNDFFLKKKKKVATLLKKWNSLDYNMRQYKD